MIENNNHSNNHFKLVHFKSKWQMFLLSGLVMQVLLVGCTAKDEEAPVITSVTLNEETIIVEASDNVEISGYLIINFEKRPKLITVENENWQSENKLVTTEDGTYYVWVKDSSGNISEYDETINVSLHLAKRFDHLNWLTPAEGTKVIDGVTYDLAELKAEYGDLYRFVEPLTDEEIESRFTYIAKFFEIQRKVALKQGYYEWYVEGGLFYNDKVDKETISFKEYVAETVTKSSNDLLLPFKKYFGYSEMTGNYSAIRPSYNSSLGAWGVGTDIINQTTLDDKNFLVRYVTTNYEKYLNAYIELGIEPSYAFENWEWE